MVSEKVEVISRKAGEEKAFKWISDGKGDYEVKESDRDSNGTTVICHLNEDGKEYTMRWRIESIVDKYSNHIPFPIYLHYRETEHEEKGKDSSEKIEEKEEKREASVDVPLFGKSVRPGHYINPEDKFYSEFCFISVVLGLFGLVLPLFSTLAIVFGIGGLMQAQREYVRGKWMAYTGIVLGFVGIILIIVAIFWGMGFIEEYFLRFGGLETLLGNLEKAMMNG